MFQIQTIKIILLLSHHCFKQRGVLPSYPHQDSEQIRRRVGDICRPQEQTGVIY